MAGLLTSGELPTSNDQAERLAGRERGRARETVRVRVAAELPKVAAIATGRGVRVRLRAHGRPDGCCSILQQAIQHFRIEP